MRNCVYTAVVHQIIWDHCLEDYFRLDAFCDTQPTVLTEQSNEKGSLRVFMHVYYGHSCGVNVYDCRHPSLQVRSMWRCIYTEE